MHNFRRLSSTLFLVVILALSSTEALARKYHDGGSSTGGGTVTTLSSRTVRYLAKSYLRDFQAVDPSITYQSLTQYIYSLNATSTSQAEAGLQDYLASLQTTSTPVNHAPTIGGTPAVSVDEGQTYLFTPSASDPDSDSLVFSIASKPAWASFDSASGTLSGTPDFNAAGSYGTIRISVSDGALTSSLPGFTITVNDVAQNPVDPPAPVTGAPTLVSAAVAGDKIALSWTQNNDVPDGGYDAIIDGVDTNATYRTTATSLSIGGLDLSRSHCFAVQARYVAANEFYDSNQLCTEATVQPNQAPVISGTPSTSVNVGDAYLFKPTASDADGDSLSFSIVNKPAWASFDANSGTLTGTPAAADVGSYAGIEIRVSDGQASVSLAPFSVEVKTIAPTVVMTTLNWTAPVTRADGSALPFSQIDGYRIYMGDSINSLTPVMDLNDSSLTQYSLSNVQAGTHYFGITAYDLDGNESAMSNILMKTGL